MKTPLLNGLTRNYQPKDDEGETLPGEYQKVQLTVQKLNADLIESLSRQIDVNATVDRANTAAAADVVFGPVGAGFILTDVPITTLMYLEKQLQEVKAYISKLPVLDPSVDWSWDAKAGYFKSKETQTHRTVKVTKPIVLYPATEKHAAQTQLITEDEINGYWTTQRLSGALPAEEIRAMLSRVEAVIEAVVRARAEANEIAVDDVKMGKDILTFIFGATP
jgi:hypothetical protein